MPKLYNFSFVSFTSPPQNTEYIEHVKMLAYKSKMCTMKKVHSVGVVCS